MPDVSIMSFDYAGYLKVLGQTSFISLLGMARNVVYIIDVQHKH
jgi:hypothetical protein